MSKQSVSSRCHSASLTRCSCHLPFDSHVGYLAGAEDYDYGYNEGRNVAHDCGGTPKSCLFDFWHDTTTGADIHNQVYYSTNWYTEWAQSIIKRHSTNATTKDTPLWIHLTYQGVHSPYVAPPAWEHLPANNTFWYVVVHRLFVLIG